MPNKRTHKKSSYKEEYPDLLEKEFRSGGNINSFSSRYSVPGSTIYMWMRLYPELRKAYEIGTAAAKVLYEEKIEQNLENPNFSHYGAAQQYTRKYSTKRISVYNYEENDSWTNKAKLITDMLCTGQLESPHAKTALDSIQSAITCEQIDTLRNEIASLRETVTQLVNERA